jgi:hypothetical protein
MTLQFGLSIIVTLGLLNTGIHGLLFALYPLGHIYGVPYWVTMLVSLHISLRLLAQLMKNHKKTKGTYHDC